MLEINPCSKYANVMERALYNTVLHAMSEDGKSFFYTNALEVLPKASRLDSRKGILSRQGKNGLAAPAVRLI